MSEQLLSESAENARQIDIVVTIDSEELEAAQRRAEDAASRSASECNALLAMGIGFLLGGFFFGDE